MKLYFGFGANRDTEMIRAITGRGAFGVPARISDFQLGVESFKDIPVEAREILSEQWDEGFVSYGIVRKQGAWVNGRLWVLTDRQREQVLQWELAGKWSHNVRVVARVNVFGIPISIHAVSEELLQQIISPVSGSQYQTFVVSKERLLAVAEKVRVL